MMEENIALVEVKKLDIAVIFTDGGMDKLLEGIKSKATSLVPDLSTDMGRKEIASMAYKVARSKTLIDDLGKETIADWKKKVDNINGHRKKARDYLDKLKDEVRQPLTEWEEEQERIRQEKVKAEEERVAGIQEKIDRIAGLATFRPGTPSETIHLRLSAIKELEVTEEIFMEFTEKAATLKDKAIREVSTELETMKKWEIEQAEAKAEAERLAKQKAEQDAQAAKLAEAQRKLDEEKSRVEAEKKAEETRKAREEFERKAREEARIKAEKEAKEKVEREAREAKEKAEREAREKREREEAEAKEKARQEALAPDKEKLITWIYRFNTKDNPRPHLESKEANDILYFVETEIEIILQEAEEKARAL